MGIFSFLRSQKPSNKPPHQAYLSLVIDLSEFRCGYSKLGEPVSELDFFATALSKRNEFQDETHGFDIGTQEDLFDDLFLTMERFPGQFRHSGEIIRLTAQTGIDEILARFGDPYWRDEDPDEVILFYEDGLVELQFEFPDKEKLGFITMTRSPLLADGEQRQRYGVTKAWPPKS